jgi:hypothetical protein
MPSGDRLNGSSSPSSVDAGPEFHPAICRLLQVRILFRERIKLFRPHLWPIIAADIFYSNEILGNFYSYPE